MNKQHILSEIKRVAEANDGKAPGRELFRTETGIKDYDWEKYWPNWSGALKEAGFSPNKFHTAHDENLLIEQFIVLIRELGHFPSFREARFRARNDKKFPSTKIFERFGGQPGLVARVREFSLSNSGFDDVLAICDNTKIVARDLGEEEGADESDVAGFVYLIKSGRYYKIGKTNAIGRREYELGLKLAEEPKTVHVIETDDPTGIEAYWHKRFESKRVRGEFFELTSTDVKAFKKRRKFM